MKLHLFPGIDFPPSHYRVDISTTNEMADSLFKSTEICRTVKHITFNTYPDTFSLEVEVYNISNLSVQRYNYSLRVDQLILLNLASKLLSFNK